MNEHKTACTDNTPHISCHDCALHSICDPTQIGEIAIDITEALVLKKKPVKAGESIYKQGQPFNDLFAFTTGSAKEVWHPGQPDEQIISFKLKGELAGQCRM